MQYNDCYHSNFEEAAQNLQFENFKLKYFIMASKQGWNSEDIVEDVDDIKSPSFQFCANIQPNVNFFNSNNDDDQQ